MMNKKIYLLFFQLLLVKTLLAQNKTYQLELPDNLGKINTPNIVIDTVIDARFNKSSWGVVMTGLFNKRIPVSFENGTSRLKYCFDRSILSDQDAEHLIMIVKNLWIDEQRFRMKEIGTCDLEILLCKKDKDNQWRVVHEFEGQVESSDGLANVELTLSTPKRVKEIFEKALSDINTDRLAINDGKIYTLAPLMLNDCIAFKSDNMKFGFYKNFKQFYNNQGQSLNIEIEKTLFNGSRYKLIDAKTGNKVKRYFGFHDGKNLYLNCAYYGQVNSKYYSQVVSLGRYMLVDDTYVHPSTSAVVMLSGFLGAIVVNALAKRGMILDVYTGQSIVLSKKTMKELLTPYPDILAEFNKVSSRDDTFERRKAFIDALNKIEKEKIN
jgi:hypothetical protein